MSYRQPFQGEYPITQKYGEVIDGVTYKGRPHSGIDYGCPSNTPILASGDGKVMYTGNDNDGYGKYIIIEHPDGKATLYAHLSKVICYIGKQVHQGEIIGYSGSTGNSTGPHLHFEAREKWNQWNTHRNPITFLPMMSVDETVTNCHGLKEASEFSVGDVVTVSAPLGCKAYFRGFSDYTVYQQGTKFQYTGETEERNGYTYMKVVPLTMEMWVAVNDGDCQILDK